MTLESVRADVLKKFGKESISNINSAAEIDVISSGSLLLDIATGIGGLPRGRLVELYGRESSGKSTIALEAAKQCQEKGLAVLMLDYEHSFSSDYAERIGVDTSDNKFVLSQPETLEQGMKIAELFLAKPVVGLIVVDSLAAMVPESELNNEIGASNVAPQARAMSQVLRRFTHKIHESNTLVIFVNHIRDVIATLGRGQRRTTPGGSALKFYSSMRIELQPIETTKEKAMDFMSGKDVDSPAGSKVKAFIVKNKMARPFREGIFYLSPDAGLDEPRAVLDIAKTRGIITQNGSRYVLPFQSREGNKALNLGGQQAVLDYFKFNPDKYDVVLNEIKNLANEPSIDDNSASEQENEQEGEENG